MNEIVTVQTENLRPAPWKATYILRPDLKLLEQTLLEDGIQYPIIAQRSTGYIIDGFARWLIAQKHEEPVPVMWRDLDEVDSMILHVRMNRGRGSVVAKDLSNLIQRALRSQKYEYDELREMLNMTVDEYDVLADGSLVKRKKAKEHKYSKAWVPVETSGYAEKPQIERPKTKDR